MEEQEKKRVTKKETALKSKINKTNDVKNKVAKSSIKNGTTVKNNKSKDVKSSTKKTANVKNKDVNALTKKNKIIEKINQYEKEKTSLSILEVAFLLIIVCIFGLLLGLLFNNKNNEVKSENTSNLNKLIEDYNYILNNYYGDIEITEDTLLDAAINGMLSSLQDTHSVYMDENTANNFNITLEGSYEGLGVEIANNLSTGRVVIVTIFEDTPASKYGLQVGDEILSINGEDVTSQTSTYIANYIKNSTNPEFILKVKRNDEELEINVKREMVVLNSVSSKIFEKNGKKIGYIYVSIFANNTYEQFKKELDNLESQGISSLIIDFRDNSGGHMYIAQNMISLFIDSEHIVYQTEDKTGITKTYSSGSTNKTYPIVLIGNTNSASASEIVISSLKDNLAAKLVGEKTYGKGTVQELHTLPDGTEYKFTIKKWLTPNGACINGEGITPDYEISLTEKYYNNPSDENDEQLQKALEILQ